MSRQPIDPEPAQTASVAPEPSAPRSSASRAVLVYTAGRLVAFLVSLGVLRLLGFRTYALFLGALILSALLSLLLLRRQRAAVSESLATRPKRHALTRRPSGRRGGRPGGDTGEVDEADAYDPYADDEDDPEVEARTKTDSDAKGSGDAADRSAQPRQ